MQGRVLAFGDVNVDLVTTLPRTDLSSGPVAPETDVYSGGTVGNTAYGLGRLGCPVSFAGKVGDDAFGRFIKEEFIQAGVETSSLITDKEGFTVMILAFIDEEGERHITVWPPRGGAHTRLTSAEIPPVMWDGVSWFHTSGISLRARPTLETTLKAMEEARSRGIPVSLDLNTRKEFFGWTREDFRVFAKAAELSDFILGSLDEEILPLAEEAAGDNSDSHTDSAQIIAALSGSTRTIIGRRGPEGTVIFYPDESGSGRIEVVPCFKVALVDALGAGDAFNAGFIDGMMRDMPIKKAVLRGNAAAAVNLQFSGARGIPDRESVESMFQSHGSFIPSKPV